LGCRGPTPSKGRRLVSWPGHLCIKLLHAHNGGQAQALKVLHDDGLFFSEMSSAKYKTKYKRLVQVYSQENRKIKLKIELGA